MLKARGTSKRLSHPKETFPVEFWPLISAATTRPWQHVAGVLGTCVLLDSMDGISQAPAVSKSRQGNAAILPAPPACMLLVSNIRLLLNLSFQTE